jgi:hypothetical protein
MRAITSKVIAKPRRVRHFGVRSRLASASCLQPDFDAASMQRVARHRPLRIGRMVRTGSWAAAAPIAAEIGADDGKVASQQRGDTAPH